MLKIKPNLNQFEMSELKINIDLKEEKYLLQRIDCNCNDCGFMKRDAEKFKHFEQIWHDSQLDSFTRRKERLEREIAEIFKKEGETESYLQLKFELSKMKFFFDRSALSNYGKCLKFDKEVSFWPNTCQLDTQKCFVHRKDYQHN